MDFGLGDDRIDVSAIDADVATQGDQAFRIVDTFSGSAGELVVNRGGSQPQIQFDVDGDGQSDFTLLFYAAMPDDLRHALLIVRAINTGGQP